MHARLVLAATTAALLHASAAGASPYSVFSCRTPADKPLTATGWVQTRGGDMIASNDCETSGALATAFTGAGPWPGGSTYAQQQFTAPAGTRITGLHMTRRILGLTAAQHGIAYYLYADATELEACDPANGRCTTNLDGLLEVPKLDAGNLRVKLGCAEFGVDQCQNSGQAPRVEIPKVVMTLDDAQAPTISNIQGNLPGADDAVTGPLTATFDAQDVGSGVYRAVLNVDGAATRIAPAGGGDCADLDPTDTDPYEFAAAAPCPLQVSQLALSVDTTKLANGAHTVDAYVEDAAGNRTTIVGARPIVVDNPVPQTGDVGPANGINADVKGKLTAWFDRNQKTAYRNRYGRRSVIRGRLVDRDAKSIQGARIDVYHRVHGKLTTLKLHALTKTGLKTRKDGRLTLILPLDLTTRDIVLVYRATRPGPVASSQTLTLTVVSAAGNVIHQRPGPLGRREV